MTSKAEGAELSEASLMVMIPGLVASLKAAGAALLAGEQERTKGHLQTALAFEPVKASRHAVCIWFLRQMRLRLDPHDGRLDRLALSKSLPPAGIGRAPAATRLLMLAKELDVAKDIREILSKVVAKKPSDAGLQLMAGQLALQMDDGTAAERFLSRASMLGFPSPTPLLGLAQLAKARGRSREQRELVMRATKMFPLFVDPIGVPGAERLLILNALPRPWCSDWRDAYNQSNLIRTYMALAGQAGRGLDVLMLGGLTLTQINTMALPPVSTVLNNLGNAEIMEQAGHATLIEALARRLAVRLLNPPAAVLKTSRAGNYARFGGRSEFIFPKTVRFSPSSTDGRHDARTVLAQFPLPVIVRSVVGHEGNRVFLCRSQDELKAALAKFRGADCYAIAFHDCQVREGLWRKFRVLCIGGEVIPASVHYSDEWNVHLHRSRDISTALPDAETVKSAFRKDPAATIGAANWDIILKVCAAVDLDIFGIDFGFDRDGRLVLYEINANMRASPLIFSEQLDRLLWQKQ